MTLPTVDDLFDSSKQPTDPYAACLLEDVKEIIRWADRNAERSLQAVLGASEIGDECDRKLVYRLEGMAHTNRSIDSWHAIVGTAVHAWLEKAVNDFEQVHAIRRWLTEVTVQPSALVRGHSDLYDIGAAAVVDWKTMGNEKLKTFRAGTIQPSHRIQLHVYGKGQVMAGRPVERIAIVALPRNGWLRDAWAWSEPYDPDIADQALDRVVRLQARAQLSDLPNHPDTWQRIPANPSRLCGWCPWYRPSLELASAQGCPGK